MKAVFEDWASACATLMAPYSAFPSFRSSNQFEAASA